MHGKGRPRSEHARAAVALAIGQGKTKSDAALAAGVHRNTVERWTAEPGFDDAAAQISRDTRAAAIARNAAILDLAMSELETELCDESVAVRHKAAVEILDRGGLGRGTSVKLDDARTTEPTEEIEARAARILERRRTRESGGK